jgi:ABC-type glutathione transport system ATPase component
VLLVVHDLALATAVADRVVVVHDGRTEAAGEPTAVLTPERLGRIWKAGRAPHRRARPDGAARGLDPVQMTLDPHPADRQTIGYPEAIEHRRSAKQPRPYNR